MRNKPVGVSFLKLNVQRSIPPSIIRIVNNIVCQWCIVCMRTVKVRRNIEMFRWKGGNDTSTLNISMVSIRVRLIYQQANMTFQRCIHISINISRYILVIGKLFRLQSIYVPFQCYNDRPITHQSVWTTHTKQPREHSLQKEHAVSNIKTRTLPEQAWPLYKSPIWDLMISIFLNRYVIDKPSGSHFQLNYACGIQRYWVWSCRAPHEKYLHKIYNLSDH